MALKMTIAVATYGHTAELKNGNIPIEGVDPEYITVQPQIAAFRRMVRDVEFDACELACTTYICARAYGAPFIGLPVFLVRRFHHEGIVCRPDSGIKTPKDLEGKNVGVRAYSVTTGVWTRGILINDYGMDSSKVTWYVDDEEHVTQLKLPPNVKHVKPGDSLADMMERGELQAGFTANAGIGRKGAPKEGWEANATAAPAAQQYYDLIPNSEPIEFEWYKKTGIYPVHGTLVVKEKLLKDNPWLAKSLFKAFNQAKEQYLAKLRSGEATTANDKKYKKFATVVGDPLPYGIKPNLPTINALIKYAEQMGLTPRKMTLEELFVGPEK